MSPRTKIKAREILSDIRARASDFELMSKYGLSVEQLDKVLEKLAESGMLRRGELVERGGFFDDPANRTQTRRLPRTYLRLPPTIEDVENPSNTGLVTDLSVMGFRTRGIESEIGEKKTFTVQSSEFKSGTAIKLAAVCRWRVRDGVDRNLWASGFQIIDVSDDDLEAIRRLIALLGMKDSDLVQE